MQNPYLSPQSSAEIPEEDIPRLKALYTRREFIGREESILTMSLLCLLTGVAVLGIPIIWMAEGRPALAPPEDWNLDYVRPQMFSIAMNLIAPLLSSAILLAAGWNLRRFNTSGRVLGSMVSVMTVLVLFPIGLLIGGYFLFILHETKGRAVFSRDYLAVVAATSDLKASASRWPWVLAFLLTIRVILSIFD